MEGKTSGKYSLEMRDSEMQSLISGAHNLTESLCKLDQKEKDTITALLAIGQMVAVHERASTRKNPSISADFYQSIGTLSPNVVEKVGMQRISISCLDESIAYATAMAKCREDETKSEDECDRENAEDAAGEIICVMNQIENLKGILSKILDIKFPPGPQPRPID